MLQLKPHVMKLMRDDFNESFTESQAAVFYDEYFAGTQLRGTDPQDLDYMANFLQFLKERKQETTQAHEREYAKSIV